MERLGFDFGANRSFWRRWGNDAALPLRHANLKDLQLVTSALGIQSWLYGRSLRDAIRREGLGEDHDDDLLLEETDLASVKKLLIPAAEAWGFEVIRDLPEMLSLIRFERYVDIHPNSIDASGSIPLRVNGQLLTTFEMAGAYVDSKYPIDMFPRKQVSMRKASRNFRRRLAGVLQSSAQAITPGARETEGKLVSLSEQDFLSIRFEDESSMNWRWRGDHLRRVSSPGATIGDSIQNLLASADYPDFKFNETDTSRSFYEPINLSRKFWQSGDSFFLLPLVYGFRHLVMPYHAANLYIVSGLSPKLYSADYYDNLPQMTDDEIRKFLKNNPVEVRDGNLVSGRHRAAAMMGRLMRGEEYIPFCARIL